MPTGPTLVPGVPSLLGKVHILARLGKSIGIIATVVASFENQLYNLYHF